MLGKLKFTKNKVVDYCCIIVFFLYALRHVNIGVDLGDTGYNYANYQYMGYDHMDPMWLFATFFSNAVGWVLTRLPFGNTLIGMNCYTALAAWGLALMGYWFARRVLQLSWPAAFLSQMIALSLCWCPTAKLYDYLTFLCFSGSTAILYLGLLRRKNWYLFFAGALLGLNVFVRFSNLPQAAMILAVWLYCFLQEEKVLSGILHKTKWCLLGYLLPILLLGLIIHLKYGIGEYIQGIGRILMISENASDYSVKSMLMGMVLPYIRLIYYLVRIAVFVAIYWLWCKLCTRLWGRLKNRDTCLPGWLLGAVKGIAGMLLMAVLLVWLFRNRFYSLAFYSYDPIYYPATAILFFVLVAGGSLVIKNLVIYFKTAKELRAKAPKANETILALMMVLLLLLTTIGSNNSVYPGFNHLFLLLPFLLKQLKALYAFSATEKGAFWRPICHSIYSLLVFFFVICFCFGLCFTFKEGTGVQKPVARVEGIPALEGIRLSEEDAQQLQGIWDALTEKRLVGPSAEVLLYGNIPAISFYFQMPAAFNPWPDLDSFSAVEMENAMEQLQGELERQEKERPLVIAGKRRVLWDAPKWKLIQEFMDKNKYTLQYENDYFMLWY